MPELPDVEGFRARFVEHAAGRRVDRVEAPAPDVVRNTTPQGLGRALHGRRFGDPHRHGKWLSTPTDGPSTLVWHFGMTGSLEWDDAVAPRHPHDRVVLVLDGRELRLRMMRKLGGLWLVRGRSGLETVTGPLGPDAHGIDIDDLRAALRGRGSTKAALMDQRRVAGAGNLVVDETCWRARVHPRRPGAEMSDDDVRRVHRALAEVLAEAVPAGRVPPREDWLTGARDTPDPHCPRCGARLESGQVAGRATWWCPDEQRLH